ncbi:SDR family NAD(P)-dependent oxidoreductase [Modestobacter excelsi]|uniref:SDR family NAD(P)-dependent oxidoreductase n=1 Tax=Modestobacter excelsi TaxID=2213161 RepID=UPI001FECF79F|nr:SDR family NAD(P)-dependent oxidoreductase [Modestobacter excelsi]
MTDDSAADLLAGPAVTVAGSTPRPALLGRPVPKAVVVTGASGGIGRAFTVAFARRGDRVALLARAEGRFSGSVSRAACGRWSPRRSPGCSARRRRG